MPDPLADLGIVVTPTHDGFAIDGSALASSLKRLSWAAGELAAAWAAVPPGARERMGTVVVTLRPDAPAAPEHEAELVQLGRVRRQG